MNLAYDNVTPLRPDLRAVEQRVADTDDGFMRVANELTDSILMADLTIRQMKIMLAVMRKTYGFNKPMDRITNTQIAAMTGIHHTHVCSAKRQLIDRGLLVSNGSKIGINKHVSMWDEKEVSQISETLAEPAKQTLARSANTHSPKQLNTKDNIQKTKDNTDPPLIPPGEKPKKFDPLEVAIPVWLDSSAWSEWVQYRQQSKKPIKTAMTVTKAFNLLKECFDEGHDPADVINTSIANSYQGLFKPKGLPKRPRPDQDSPHWNSREGWKDFL
ncbi:replication protein [Erwinia sp. Leaf53]|uniref:replication protein n=1 Tax=Erwinia sp. Leaf53 TaxID=1736225 RepID=UPI00092E596A|nr:replication protein [Erwinia sp. Leaf53]